MVWTGHLSAHLSTIPLPHELSFRGNAECATLEGPENCRGARVRPAQEFVAGLLPSLVIVGRPNVGKSTLFNRLTGTRRSIVTDEPGITRDRIYGKAEWRGRELEIVDTDRKSTRLNSSHQIISYAVFCLKKKKNSKKKQKTHRSQSKILNT